MMWRYRYWNGMAALLLALASGIGASPVRAAQAGSAVSHYTVQRGQSLSDVAADVTQSHNQVTLARAERLLFDANPHAFMKHDSGQLMTGVTLRVPDALMKALGAQGHAATGTPLQAAPAVSASSAASAAATKVAPALAAKPVTASASISASGSIVAASAPMPASTAITNGAMPTFDARAWSGVIASASMPDSAIPRSSPTFRTNASLSGWPQFLAFSDSVLTSWQNWLRGTATPMSAPGHRPLRRLTVGPFDLTGLTQVNVGAVAVIVGVALALIVAITRWICLRIARLSGAGMDDARNEPSLHETQAAAVQEMEETAQDSSSALHTSHTLHALHDIAPPQNIAMPSLPPAPRDAAPAAPSHARLAFPRDAISALDALDMALPPRAGEAASVTQSRPQPPQPASTASTAASSVPADVAALQPALTPAQQIVRNRLDLVREYVALGDIDGARTLLHDVMNAHDAGDAVMQEARTLLARLASLS